MAVYESKRGSSRHPPASIAVMMMMIVAAVILINANSGGAAVVVKSNVTYGSCIGGRVEGCLIAEDMELEWLMEYSSHVARVLKTIDPKPVTGGANNAAQTPCGTAQGNGYNYDTQGKPPKPNGSCTPPSKYKRGCSS